MLIASIGNHSALRVSPNEREQIRMFYTEILGCQQTKTTEAMDYFRMGDAHFVAFLYTDAALKSEEARKSVWLEIKSDNPKDLEKNIRAFGVFEIETAADKDHLYFQAPGGQVYRVVKNGEDLSRFER